MGRRIAGHPLSGIRCLIVIAVAGCIGLASASAARADLSWDAPVLVDGSGGTRLNGLACPSTSRCVTVDRRGAEVTFDPAVAAAGERVVIAPRQVFSGVACPSSTQCTAIDYAGGEVTFDPGSPGTATRRVVDPQALAAVSCPSASECVTVDQSGGEITFDPNSSAQPARVQIDTTSQIELLLDGLTCPTLSRCVAIDTHGREVTFDPGDPQGASVNTVDAGQSLTAVACPLPGQCTVVDQRGGVLTFDPTAPGAPPRAVLDSGTELSGVDCPTADRCVAIDYDTELTFDPAHPDANSRTQIGPNGVGRNGYLPLQNAVRCPADNRCVSVDESGDAVPFDPSSTGTPTSFVVDPGRSLDAIACPAADQCTVLNDQGDELTFDPATPSNRTQATISETTSLDQIACPTTSLCIAIAYSGTMVVFDPHDPAQANRTIFDRQHVLEAIACVSARRCTVVDGSGGVTTFDPAAPNTASRSVLSSHPLWALTCPSSHQCSAISVEDSVTFDPTSPSSQTATIRANIGDGSSAIVAMVCASVHQCTALQGYDGKVATFDPTSTSGLVRATVDPGQYVAGLACPYARLCVGPDTNGGAVTFDPLPPSSSARTPIDQSGGLANSIACAPGFRCTVINDFGREISGTGVEPSGGLNNPPGPAGTGTSGAGSGLSSSRVSVSGTSRGSSSISLRLFVGRSRVVGHAVSIALRCAGLARGTCTAILRLSFVSQRKGRRSAAAIPDLHVKTLEAGQTTVVLPAGRSKAYTIFLNARARRLLLQRHVLRTRIALVSANGRILLTRTVVFHAPPSRRRR
ncbi:MAG: hypothetical protein M3070_08655 [Actinomycetota bacterium]|nr:hypothetical protein [Actinomycetota bacterium]